MKALNWTALILFIHLLPACSAAFSLRGEDVNRANPSIDVPNEDALPDDGIIRSEFRLADLDAPVDYVIVLDNSTSMDQIINRIRNGLLDAANQELFPDNSKIMVMNTMIGDPDNLSTTGQGVNRYEGIDLEPGFLDFVHEAAVRTYRQAVPEFADRWQFDACFNKRFEPKELSSQSIPCLVAAMQVSGARVGAEAGALAFKQLIQKHEGQQLFRNEALVNVIFVSDTHDPGRPDPILAELTPDYAELWQVIRIDNPISGLKFHALAPNEVCTTEELYELSYYQLSDASGGVKLDPCKTDDYSEFVQSMINSSKKQAPAFRLEPPAAEILGVRLDGRLFSAFNLHKTGSIVYLDLQEGDESALIEIIYRKKEE